MALKSDLQLPSGLVANYWKLIKYAYDANNNHLHLKFEVYASNALRQVPGTLPASVEAVDLYQIGITDLTNINNGGNGNPIAGLYTYLKTLPKFNGATDI